MLRHSNRTASHAKRNALIVGKKVRRRNSDRYAVARQNVWQVLDQSPAAWRVNGGTGKNTNTKLSPCKALRNRYPVSKAHKKFWSAAVLLPLLRSQPKSRFCKLSKPLAH